MRAAAKPVSEDLGSFPFYRRFVEKEVAQTGGVVLAWEPRGWRCSCLLLPEPWPGQ